MRFVTAWLAYAVALISGGIGIFAYSPFDYWWVAFLSASGLIWLAICNAKRTALFGTFLWGVSYFAVGVNWVHVSMIQFGGVPEIVSYLAVLLLAAYLALYPLLFTFVVQRFHWQNPWLLAAVFTATEYLRGVVFTGFPWLQFGYSQIDTPFANVATLFGVEGLTAFVMIVSGYLVQLAKNSQKLTACIGLITVLAVSFATKFTNWVEIDHSKPTVKISLVQGNIEQQMKWNPAHFDDTLRTYGHLINQLIGKSDVVILPESAIPATEDQIEPILLQLDQLGRANGSEIIIGTLYRHPNGIYNSAVTLGGAEPYAIHQSPRYNKHHLVPFGEYVPFGNLLNWMRDVFILPINLSQGEFVQPSLLAGNRKFNLAICYEIIFGHQLQQNQQAQQADYLLTITNDAWFGESSGPWQHFQMARMRALELGKPLVRATNTGVTAFVNFDGKVTALLPQFEANTLTQSLQSTKGETPYAQFGRWLWYAICGLILLVGIARRK
ncbi:apolipoprotein N-acyltransferase [Pasteurellaceae bacterium Orientalotternb1]|nr:apolipoprotein N-acyltransferase [Pasteurellaceae bacterium Orientalotternb1]